MIVGLGTDLVDSRRIARELGRGGWRGDEGVFTAQEVAYCSADNQPELRYAICFAAKEATLKALGMEIPDLGVFREVELGLDGGSPILFLRYRPAAAARKLGASRIHVSVASTLKNAAAMVILESEDRRQV